MNEDVAVDFYCGLGGWTDGLLAEGFTCIGFDIERHDYGTGGYPGQLILQDVLTVTGAQFRSIADRIRVLVSPKLPTVVLSSPTAFARMVITLGSSF